MIQEYHRSVIDLCFLIGTGEPLIFISMILAKFSSLRLSGPGHCMVTSSPDSTEFFIVYHTHTYFDKPSGNRNMCIDRLNFDNGVLKVTGPTRTPQPLPGGIPFRIVYPGH